MVWRGMAWHGIAWHGMVWYGSAWHGRVWYGVMQHVRYNGLGVVLYARCIVFLCNFNVLIIASIGHTNTIGCLQHSPTATAFISCSDDNRARFWYSEGI